MLLRSAGFRRAWAWFVLLVFSGMAEAGDWRDSQLELARKISQATGPGVISLELTNRSSLPAGEVEQIRRGLIASLEGAGVRVWQKEQSSSEVTLTLSEDLNQYVWVAEVREAVGDRRLIILSAPRERFPLPDRVAMPLNLHATHLVSRPDAILAAALLDGNPAMLALLSPIAVAVYGFTGGRWTEASSLAIEAARPFPRDLRGRIVVHPDHLFDAYLPGLICHTTALPRLALDCLASDDPWPLAGRDSNLSAFFTPARNFFSGALVPGIGQQRSAPAFYTAAGVSRERYTLWIFKGIDGQLHLLDGMNHRIAGEVHWGADIAGVRAPCRPASEVLATSATSGLEDSIQAFEFPDREPIAVSEKLALNGKVTALWTGENGETAMAVVKQATGDYEVVLISLDCSR